MRSSATFDSHQSKMIAQLILMVLSGLLLGGAWLVPSTVLSAMLGWFWLIPACLTVRHERHPYLLTYAGGVLSHLIAFRWLVETISEFGGFGPVGGYALYFLFSFISATQFLIFVFVFRNLPRSLDSYCVRSALAWITCELISIKIFPWHLGHTQAAFSILTQVADLGGSVFISWIMWCVADAQYLTRWEKASRRGQIIAGGLLLISLTYGSVRIHQIDSNVAKSPSLKVAVVQANLSVEEKHNVKYFLQNVEQYKGLTAQAIEQSPNAQTLVIWPESVIVDWIRERTRSVQEDPRLPYYGPRALMLIGSLTQGDNGEPHNSALSIRADGSMPQSYHKRILMPFGEYMPLASIFPFLKDLNPNVGDFVAGSGPEVFNYAIEGMAEPAKVSPLICYEDVVQNLARESVQAGAELLVNITNDAWFGNTVAPLQHHLIASFRAIENRRFLVRSTNSGLTAIVDPVGRTISELPVFTEGVLSGEVRLLSTRTMYSYLGNYPWGFVAAISIICALFLSFRRCSKSTPASRQN